VSARRSRRPRWGVGLFVASVVNLLLLAGLAIQGETPHWRSPPSDAPPITVDLSPRAFTPTRRIAPARAKSPPVEPPSSPPLSPGKRQPAAAVPPALAQTGAPSPSPSTSGPGGQPAAQAPVAGDDQARTASALRRLGACARPEAGSPAPRDEKLCDRRWADSGQTIDAIPTGKRIEYDAAKNRLSDLQETSAKVRKELGNHDVEGNNLHYGCTLIGGKARCSTY
jgi:hypothetical protein